MITVSSEWRSLSQKSDGELTVLARLYYGDESNYISLTGGESRVLFGEKFLGSIMKIPKIVSRLDMKTHEHSITIAKLQIDNLKFEPGRRWSDILSSSDFQSSGANQGFYNRRIDLRLFLPGISSFENCFTLLEKGVIRDIKHTRKMTTLEIEDGSELVDLTIGTFLTDADAADGVSLPLESLGKIKPFIYGDHRFYYGDISNPSLTTASQAHNLVPSVYLGVDTSGRHRWLIAGHQMENMNTDESDSDKVWGFHSGINRMVELQAFTVEQNTSSGCIISHANNPPFHDYFYGDGSVSNENNTAPGDWQNASNANDKNVSTFALSELDAGFLASASAQIDVDFSGYVAPVEDGNITNIIPYFLHKWDMGSGLVNTNVTFGEGSISLPNFSSESTLSVNALAPLAGTLANALASVLIQHERSLTGANTETTARVYEVWKQVRFKEPNELLPLHSGGQGREYGTEINGRSTSDTDPRTSANYTETHEDNDLQSGVELMPNQVDRDFSGASAWTNVDINAYDETGNLTITADRIDQYCELPVASAPATAAKNYILEFDVANIVGSWEIQDFTGVQKFGRVTANGNNQKIYFTVNSGITGGLRVVALSATASADFDNFSLMRPDLIENFAGISESVLRDLQALVTADIDTGSMNVVSNDRPIVTWKCSSSLIEQMQAKAYLFSILRDSQSYLWWQPDGTIKTKAMETSWASSDRTIDAREVTKLKYDRTPIRDIMTAINVFYLFDPVSGRFLSETGVSEDTDQQARYNVTQARSLLEYMAKHIANSTTAGTLTDDFLLGLLKQPHNIIEGQLPRHQLDLDLGDIIQFTDLPYDPYGEDLETGVSRNGQSIFKFCWIFQMGRGEVAEFSAIQLHEL